MKNEFVKMQDAIPSNDESVVLIKEDGSGCCAIFKNGTFLCNNNVEIKTEEVLFWKTNEGRSIEEELKKPCYACGGIFR